MDIVKEILLISIPAILVLITAYLILKKSIDNDRERRRHEYMLQISRTITPIKLQAYERLTLLLERITIESLVMRILKQGMTSRELHSSLLETVRTEFDHNLSQQIYVSPQAWEVIKTAKTNTVKLINSSVGVISPKASGADLSKHLLESVMELDREPARVALDFLKNEAGRMM
jgi:hypothetical protein